MFLGMMHFQDEYTYDIKRVEKCDIHYAMPDGRVLPFCTFNVFPEVYRDKIQKQYSIPSKEWENMHNDWNYHSDKYTRDVKALEASEAYKRVYEGMTNYFDLPVNAAQKRKIIINTDKGMAMEAKEKHTNENKDAGRGSGADSCACGSSSSCACGAEEAKAESSGSCGCGNCGCGGS